MAKDIRVLVVEPDHDKALAIVDCLMAAGEEDVQIVSEMSGLRRRVRELQPDIVLVDLANPSRDTLEELTIAAGPMDRTVAIFADQSDDSLTQAAIEAGVSAYVVDDLRPERVRSVISAAVVRFNLFRRMREELAETKRALEERKLIDRAKGILMRARGISEEEAYAALRKAAMDQGKKIPDLAQALVTAAELLS